METWPLAKDGGALKSKTFHLPPVSPSSADGCTWKYCLENGQESLLDIVNVCVHKNQ